MMRVAPSWPRWFITRLSVTLSSAEVASSSMSSAGPGNTARAMAMRCRWPPDSDAPPSATTVSRPIGIASMTRSRQATRAAHATRGRSASGAHRAMLSRTVPPNTNGLCGTTPICRRTLPRSSCDSGRPSK